jgi:putative transposase
VHFARNLLHCVPKAHQCMVTAALPSVFAQESAAEIESRWDDLAASLAQRFPKAAALMHEAKEDVLAFRHFTKDHWKKIWSTNLLERANVAPRGALCNALHQTPHSRRRHLSERRRQWPPADFVYTRLVGAVLLEQHEHWQLEGRRMFAVECMATIPELDDIPALQGLSD